METPFFVGFTAFYRTSRTLFYVYLTRTHHSARIWLYTARIVSNGRRPIFCSYHSAISVSEVVDGDDFVEACDRFDRNQSSLAANEQITQLSVELPYKFASCPEQEVLAPDKLPALPRRNNSVRSPLASRHWNHDLPITQWSQRDVIASTSWPQLALKSFCIRYVQMYVHG